MIANAAFLAALVMLVTVVLALQQLPMLVPYKWIIFRDHGIDIVGALAIAYLNLFGCFYLAGRMLFLKDTGRKLAHVEKQVLAGDTIVGDLSDRLEQED